MIRAHAAIVHDWFQGFHGAERVVDVIRGDVFAPDRDRTSSRSTPHASCFRPPPGRDRARVEALQPSRAPPARSPTRAAGATYCRTCRSTFAG